MFGGEDPLADAPSPDNWHHEGLTRKAADDAGWSDQAQNALAFHADYLDSYLYSPLWWFDVANGGGPARIPIVMSSQHELVKLHFDDLVHPEAVRAMWRQYLSGTAAALIWLGHAHPGSVDSRAAMAKNVVGASLHAIQDFYSHSNWIDDEDLRDRTWFEVSPERRACLSLWTGTYELPSHLGIKPHGAYLFACSVINNLGPLGRQLMNQVCHAASPFADTSLCRWIRQCQEAKPFTPPTVRGVELPDAVLWVEPGINVDTRWGAVTGVQERGLGISGREAFEAAYALAARSSCQWLHILDHVMNAAALGDFWTTVKTEGVTWDKYKTPRAPWEDFSQLPYRFISAGPYPPPQTHDDTSSWYLRLTIRTSSDTFSGTDADIVPIVNGRAYPALDHGVPPAPMVPTGSVPPTRPLDQTLLGRNDFEAGDEAAYIVGPLDEAPRTVALRNDAPDAGQTIKEAADALWRAVVGAFESLVDVFVGLWGYHADFVDEAHWTIDATSLQSLGPGVRRYFFLDCNGGSEGAYLISGWVEGTAATGAFPNGVPWRRYAAHFEKLYCVKESEWDRFTTSDEPFVLGLVIPHGGTRRVWSWRTGPYDGVNTGDVRPLGQSFPIEVPQRYGFISVACAVYESDDETPNDRDRLLAEFADVTGTGLVMPEANLFEVLGRSIASGWRLGSVEAMAFRRSPTVDVRAYRPRTFDQWLAGGEQATWTLDQVGAWSVAVPDTIDCTCGACSAAVQLPPLEVETSQIDFRPSPEGRTTADDPGRVTTLDLADCGRDRHRVEPGPEDEVPTPPRPSDGCADTTTL
jgi:hypothetical protein